MAAATERSAITFCLSPGQASDAKYGRELLSSMGKVDGISLLMDRAYEDNKTRAQAVDLGYNPVVPPNPGRKKPWDYDRALYRRRNEVERLFRRLKRFRRIFTRFDKLDSLFLGFVLLALIFDALLR